MVMIGLWEVISSSRPFITIPTLRSCAKSAISAESAPKASDNPDEERLFRDLWEETQREMVIESLKADCEVRRGEDSGSLRYVRGDHGGVSLAYLEGVSQVRGEAPRADFYAAGGCG
jgi:hypothetical protein